MYKIYFRQAIEMLKQNKFISIIAVLGTALAIMMIMVIIVTDEINNMAVAPEINRDRTFYLNEQKRATENSWRTGEVQYNILKDYLSEMKTPQYISGVSESFTGVPSTLVNREGMNERYKVMHRSTDASYWKILSFHFIEGQPFSEESFQSGLKEAVISESLARKLFKGDAVVGQYIAVDLIPFRVVGVVKDVSPVFRQASGDIWIPYTSHRKFGESENFTVMLLAKDKKDYPLIAEEVRGIEKKYSSENAPWNLTLPGPVDHNTHLLGSLGFEAKERSKNIQIVKRRKIFILLLLLLVPAINLSGLSLSRIKKRTEEIGLRKAFGAKRHIILIQVLYENLITSLIGGVIGLILSYGIIYYMRSWLLGVSEGQTIAANTLVSLPILMAVFIVSLLINLLSAGIPAYKAARMAIIQSLTQNDTRL